MTRPAGGSTADDCAAERGTPVTAAEREAMLRKYRTMAAWRQRRDAESSTGADLADHGSGGGGHGESDSDSDSDSDGKPTDAPPPDRAALRALAREFPGSLRELDLLGLPEMSRRIAVLTELANEPPGNAPAHAGEPNSGDDRWLAWILTYHALMRAALHIKRHCGRTRELSPDARARVSALVASACRVAADPSRGEPPLDEFVAAFVASVIHPPEGRIGIVVLTTLAEWFRVPPAELSRVLFPPRRPPPYQL